MKMEKLKTIKAVFEELQHLQMPSSKKELYEMAKEIINDEYKKGITPEQLKKLMYDPDNDWLSMGRHDECSGYFGAWRNEGVPIPEGCKACSDCFFRREELCYHNAIGQMFFEKYIEGLEEDLHHMRQKLNSTK